MGKIIRSGLSAGILKALGMFGGIEAIKIACSVVRTKLVAVWIGAAGVGVISLYNATLDMIKNIALLSLRQSGVPPIASAGNDTVLQAHIARSIERLAVILGLVSTIAVAALSPWLSMLTFGSYDYAWGFAVLAPTMLVTAVGEARATILQGLGRLGSMARASFYAVLASTLVAIPLFYFFRMAAIVPVLVVFPVFTSLFLVLYPTVKTGPRLPAQLFRTTAIKLIKVGSHLTVGLSLGYIADYILRAWLSNHDGVDTVGVFQAGNTIIKSYIGIFFTAIMVEFFPRISATVSRRNRTAVIVSHEISLTLWILMPVVVVFICFGDLIVRILYSNDFLAVVPYISVAITATFFRAVSYCFSYVIVARGDGLMYIFTEGLSAVCLLAFSYIGWIYGSYTGLGWAYFGQFLVFTAATWGVCRMRYGVRISPKTVVLFAVSVCTALAALWMRSAAWWLPLMILVPIAVGAYKFIRK